MTREELLVLINLKEELIPAGRTNRPGSIIRPEKITIHNTSNASPGANATSHSKFVRETGHYILNGKKHWVSWHYTVDDQLAIKQLPVNERAFHAGSQGNNISIAIEICMHKEIDQEAADTKASQLTALLCFDLGIPVANIVTHKFWTGKNCPALLLANWDSFIDKVRFWLEELNTPVADTPSILAEATTEDDSNLCWSQPPTALVGDELLFNDEVRTSLVQNAFNTRFLANGEVALPLLSHEHPDFDDHVFIHHINMSIYFNKARKLALYSACNYDKDAFIQMGRSDAFRNDNALDSSLQLGDGFYLSRTNDESASVNFIDRGHLIARRYNQWGANKEEARAGERDTYYFTTIHPQVGELNRDEWEDLESFIIDQGQLDVKRVSVIAGTFLSEDDPVATYIDKFFQDERTIKIPKLYWKVVYYQVGNELRKIAFLMSQRNRLRELPFVKPSPLEAEAIDPFDALQNDLKTYVVNSSIIEQHSGLVFSPATELFQEQEPLEVIMEDNETHPGI